MEEQRDIAIQIEGLRKKYRLGVIGGGTLQGDIQSWWARKRGKEDPNSKIGAKVHAKNEEFYALDGIELTVYKGERLGIIGHNGAGKSTLLKLLSRVTAPTEGKICIDGRISSMLEVGTGFNRELTGRENIYMNGAILGMSRAEVDSKIEDIIEFSECRQFIDTPVKRYSSGMYVKLAFSVAAHLDNEIMIMDEVLAVGDMAFQKKCLEKMSDVSKTQGRTILYVSHNMNTIRQLCDRVIVLDHGKIVFNGEVEDGIGVYIGIKAKSHAIEFLRDLPRDPEFSPHPVTMSSIEVLENKNAVFDVGSIVSLQLNCFSEKHIMNAFLRIIVKSVEGVPITMITTDTGFPLFEKENKLRCSLDLRKLVPGKFTLSPVIYEVNEYGNSVNLDGLKDVYCFEIVPKIGFNNNMIWMPRYWGYFYNEPMTVKKVNENGENKEVY